ncbi:hypothetical protein AB3N59_20460 (plasmid) [Leptospira sp. WS92.C1]
MQVVKGTTANNLLRKNPLRFFNKSEKEGVKKQKSPVGAGLVGKQLNRNLIQEFTAVSKKSIKFL